MIRWDRHVERITNTKMRTKLLLKNLNGRDHLEDIGSDARIILKLILWKQARRVQIGYLARDRDQRRAFVKTVMNL
jgi:hypothetical protein